MTLSTSIFGVGQPVGEEDDDANKPDVCAGIAEECIELLAQRRDVTAESLYPCHGLTTVPAVTAATTTTLFRTSLAGSTLNSCSLARSLSWRVYVRISPHSLTPQHSDDHVEAIW